MIGFCIEGYICNNDLVRSIFEFLNRKAISGYMMLIGDGKFIKTFVPGA